MPAVAARNFHDGIRQPVAGEPGTVPKPCATRRSLPGGSSHRRRLHGQVAQVSGNAVSSPLWETSASLKESRIMAIRGLQTETRAIRRHSERESAKL